MSALYPHQDLGANFLALKSHALLADEMGLGKTRTVLEACRRLGLTRLLVICPAAARITWKAEAAKWNPGQFPVVVSPTNLSVEVPETDRPMLVVVSPEYATANVDKLIAGPRWGAMVLDESHFFKNIEAKRTKAILGTGGLIHHTERAWFLSGTPMPNHAGELWSMLYTLGVTDMSYRDWISRYCYFKRAPYGREQRITGSRLSRLGEIRDMLFKLPYPQADKGKPYATPLALRRRKRDVWGDMPPVRWGTISVEPGEVSLTADQVLYPWHTKPDKLAELLDQEREQLRTALERGTLKTDDFDTLKTMAESVSTLRRFSCAQKLEGLARVIRHEMVDLNLYPKLVVFAESRIGVEGLRNRLSPGAGVAHLKPVTLYGASTPRGRETAVHRFTGRERRPNGDPPCRVFIGNIYAAGAGLNLQGSDETGWCSHVIFLEQSFTPGQNLQAADRVRPHLQKQQVNIRTVELVDDPLDRAVSRLLADKTRALQAIFA